MEAIPSMTENPQKPKLVVSIRVKPTVSTGVKLKPKVPASIKVGVPVVGIGVPIKCTSHGCQVVNVKVAYIRPQYNNLQEWMTDPQNVYIARKGIVFINNQRYPPTDSIWANPFKLGKGQDRSTVLREYESYIRLKLSQEPSLVDKLLALRGKRLGCWCYDDPCHGDILVKLIEEYLK